ncbi:MAG: glycerol kinase GlpK [Oscillospiraceae bacterium]|nr:glycerol kinase GlpK [Oscillospiraceae bacterium]
MNGYILALDQGTTSSRAILFDTAGNAVMKAQYPLTQIYPRPGWVEHDPMEILATQFHALAEVYEKSGVSPTEIAAVGITNQRETTVLWEKETGKPVGNAICWQCRRTADICAELEARGLGPYIQEKTGLIIDPYFSGTKLKWLLDRDPDLRRRARDGELLFGTVDSWLVWQLTGGKAHVTDVSNASRTMLLDTEKLRWDPEILRELDIPEQLLPRLVSNSEAYGAVAHHPGFPDLKGIPVCAAVGDQQAALFGQGCLRPGMAKNTYGTGCFTLMNLGSRRVRSGSGLVTTVGWQLGGETTYVLEGSVFNAGSAIQWLRDGAGVVTTAHETDILAEKAPDNQGVYFVPAFTGLGAPYWDPAARGCFFGLTRGTDRAVLCRAVLEAIAYEVADLVHTMDGDTGAPITELRVDGGASVSDFMMQFQADLLDIPVDRPQNVETTAFGAAALAGLAAGIYSGPEELEKLRLSERVFTPEMEAARRDALYGRWKKAVELSRAWGREE